MKTEYVTEFSSTGICKINVEKVIKDFNEDWFISQWHDEFTLVKLLEIRTHISEIDANKIINALNLKEEKSTLFKFGSTWSFNINKA